MKKQALGGAILVALLACAAVYYTRTQPDTSTFILAAETMPAKEYYTTQKSFSEVENVIATLEGLCEKVRMEIQARRAAEQRATANARGADPQTEPHLSTAIAELEQVMSEFAGTDQELDVAQDLLLALKKANQLDRWLDVYLKGLYEHPTHPVVARFAQDAVVVARRCGREENVLAAFQHLEHIPLDFPGKSTVDVVLRQAEKRNQVALEDRPASHTNSHSISEQ